MRIKSFLCAAVPIILCGCSHEGSEPTTQATQMVYVDLQTNKAVVGDRSDVVPAVNPATGERSLMPGMYCSRCGQWRPAPPLEELQRNPAARQCPRCGSAMSADGPWPKAAQP
jgi:DNA-directed RNA polymerase subunit RPC12/RpoP